MIKFKKFYPLNSRAIWKANYKDCNIETGGNGDYIFVTNEFDYDTFERNGHDNWEISIDNGITKKWTGPDFQVLLKAIEEIPEEEASENEG